VRNASKIEHACTCRLCCSNSVHKCDSERVCLVIRPCAEMTDPNKSNGFAGPLCVNTL